MAIKRIILLTLTFFLFFQIKAQTFIDSLFLNVPLELSIKGTYQLLSTNKTFTLVSIDTSGRNMGDDYDQVSFRTNQNYFLSTGAETYFYGKGLPSRKSCDSCLQWNSQISYEYKSAAKRDTYYENLIKVFKHRFPDSKVTDSKYHSLIGNNFHIKYKGNDYIIFISYPKFRPEDKTISIWIN